MPRFVFSLRFRLILLVLLAVLPALGLMLNTGLEQRRLATAQAQAEALRLSRLAASNQHELIRGARQLLVTLAQLPQVRDSDPAVCSALFADLLKQYLVYSAFTVARPNGDVFCSAPPLTQPVNFADRAWFQRVVQTRDFVTGEYQIGRISGKAIIVTAYPVLDAAGQIQAVVSAGLDLAWLNQLVAEAQLPEGSALTVTDRNGTILARYPEPEKWVGQALPEAPVIQAILQQRGEGTAAAAGLDGVMRLYAFTPLGGGPEASAYVSIGIPTAVAFAEADRTLLTNLAGLGLAAALALTAAWAAGDVFVLRRVKALVNATKQLADGDLSARTGLTSGQGELSQLARAFDEMAEALEQREAERQRTEEALRRANRALRTLSDCNQAVVRATDEAELLHEVCQTLVVVGGYRLAWVGFAEPDEQKTVRPVAQAGYEEGYLEPINVTWAETQPGRDPTGTAIRTGKPVVAQNILTDPNLAPWRVEALKRGYASSIALPLFADAQPFGALNIYAEDPDAFDTQAVKLLTELANDLAYGIMALHTRAERKRAEETLRESEERYRQLVNLSPDAIAVHNGGRFVFVNPAGVELIGATSPEELIGKPILDVVHPDSRDIVTQRVRQMVVESKKAPLLEEKFIRLDGTVIDVDVAAMPFTYQGKPAGQVVIRDITGRKRAEETQRRLTAIIESTTDFVATADVRGHGLYLNRAGRRMLGIGDDEDILNLGFIEYFPEPTRALILDEFIPRVIRDGVWSGELTLLSRDGREIPILFVGLAHKAPDGTVEYLSAIGRDITERKQVEEMLRASEERYRALFEGVPVGLYRTTPDGRILDANPALAETLGYPDRESFLTVNAAEVFTNPDERSQQQALLEPEEAVRHFEMQMRRRDGTLIWVRDTARPARDAEGRVLYYEGSLADITERKQAEEALRHRAGMERLVTHISTNFIYVTTDEVDNGINRALEAIGRFAGVDRSYVFLLSEDGTQMDNTHEWCAEGIGPQIENLKGLSVETMPWWMERLRRLEIIRIVRVADLPPEASVEKDILQAQDIRSVIAVPVVYGRALVGFLGFDSVLAERMWQEEDEHLLKLTAEVFVNALGHKRAQIALEQERASLAQRVAERTAELSVANAELARAARLKDEFLANMSHELRTPLNAILGLSEALLEQTRGPLNEHQLRSLRTIEESGHHLLELINDILDLSKIEAGKLEVQLEPVLIEPICQASLYFIQQTATKKKIGVSFKMEDSLMTIRADTRRLKQILVNLLTNAVKFTSEGGQVGLEVMANAEQEVVRFTVWDTGIGIAPEDLARLFKPFAQVDSSLSRQYDGTGLGLALVSRLTEMHGGSVSVDSEVGKGSRFIISLPWQRPFETIEATVLAESASEATPVQQVPVIEDATTKPRAEPALILLAEDNEATLQAMVDYLEDKGYQVTIARNGVEMIERASEERPALILMDIQMPVMDGLEAIRHIRADAELANIPIIALTALAMRGDRERCLAAGANDHLAKPVSLKGLIQAIEAQRARA